MVQRCSSSEWTRACGQKGIAGFWESRAESPIRGAVRVSLVMYFSHDRLATLADVRTAEPQQHSAKSDASAKRDHGTRPPYSSGGAAHAALRRSNLRYSWLAWPSECSDQVRARPHRLPTDRPAVAAILWREWWLDGLDALALAEDEDTRSWFAAPKRSHRHTDANCDNNTITILALSPPPLSLS